MGRRKYHGRQFCSEYHPAKKVKTKEEENAKRSYIRSEGLTTDSTKPRGFIKVVSEFDKINKLSRDCKRLTTERIP